MIPFGLVLPTRAALVPEPGRYLPRASAAVQGFRPFPARDASLRTPGLAHSQAYSRGGSQPGRQPVPGQLDAVQPHEQDVGPVRVAGIDDIAALLRPALARQPWRLSRRSARSRSACAPTRHATRAGPGAASWWTARPPTSCRTSVGGITVAVQLCGPPLRLPQRQSEHATAEGKRPAKVPHLHCHRTDPGELNRPGQAALLPAPGSLRSLASRAARHRRHSPRGPQGREPPDAIPATISNVGGGFHRASRGLRLPGICAMPGSHLHLRHPAKVSLTPAYCPAIIVSINSACSNRMYGACDAARGG